MIVTIDGPAGAGKSTIARMLADRLGFRFLDTGAMYRTVALAVVSRSIDATDHQKVVSVLNEIDIQIDGDDRILLDNRDVAKLIRSADVSQNASIVAEIPEVRERLVQLQRQIASDGDYVCEGRDQGTVAFPDAQCKIFLTAAPDVRAKRRWKEIKARDPNVDLEDVIAEQKIRDLRDETRSVGRLEKAQDAIEVRADNLSLSEVVAQLEEIVRSCVNAP